MKIKRDIEIEQLKRNLILLAEEQRTLKIKKKGDEISFSGIIKMPKDLFCGIALTNAKAGDIVTVKI